MESSTLDHIRPMVAREPLNVMTVTYTGRIDANPHLAACFIPVIFVDPNRGGFLVYRKSLELYYPLSFLL